MEKAKVYYQDALAGIIELGEEKVYKFTYEKSYIDNDGSPISQTLPLKQEAYQSDTLFSFFDGLIPEGWLLDIATETWKIKPTDRWRLLLTVCGDCIGAVKVIEHES